ncbi:MAG: glycosyltransferase family 39 protein [Acidobacteriia bacterium]|nr:glycosyltransferase family 39 protein [Terriglobia bacterium]
MTERQSSSGQGKLMVLLPLILTALVYLSATIPRGVIDYDEGNYSQVARQMFESGDWVTPYDNGVRFLEKPPLMYWLTAASFHVFGANEFALRLPTALGVIALVWVVMLIARRAADERAAVIAGLCTACSVGTYLFTREALHDIWLVLSVTLALYAFLEWHLDPLHSLRRALLFYASLAGAVMTKGLVGVAFPVGIVTVFFLLARERPKWRTLHVLPGTLLFLLLAVPWHWLAAIRNQGFLWFFFVNEQFLRFLGRHDPPVLWSLPLLTFWALILVWGFPWTAFLPAAFATSRKPADSRQRVLVVLALAWAGIILGFFSVSGRLEHYAFPALPALSLLVGAALSRTDDGKAVKWGFRGLAVLGVAVLAAGIGVGIWFVAAGHGIEKAAAARTSVISETDFSILAEMPPAILWKLLKPAAITIVSLAVGFAAALWFEAHRRRMQAVLSLAAVMVVVCIMTQWSLSICEDLISSKKFGLAVAREARPGDHLVVVGDFESANSLNFYEPLRVEVVDGMAYALIPGMKYPDAPRIVLTREEFEALWGAGGRVFVLIPRSRLGELKGGGTEMLEVMDRALVRNH